MLVQSLEAKLEAGDLLFDARQWAAAARLQLLADALQTYAPATARQQRGWLTRLMQGPEQRPDAPMGVYLHGDVGRGKSMLMDLFFASVGLEKKRRVHFHAFMLEVQKRLNALRGAGGADDPLRQIAAEIAADTWLLCFDELHIANIADAMILGRLFEGLFANGVIVVATSNWPPQRLYEGGLNRDRFLPSIALLLEKMDVVALDGAVDYRLEKVLDLPIFLQPLGPETDARLAAIVSGLTGGTPLSPDVVAVGTRRLVVPLAARGVAVLTFADLCNRPLGAADYLALTARYAVIVVTGVPVLSPARRNEMRRLMTLVDALYEQKVAIVITAEAPAQLLYPVGEGAFEFQRTVSRLVEMQSSAYLEDCRDRHPDRLPSTFTPFAMTSDVS